MSKQIRGPFWDPTSWILEEDYIVFFGEEGVDWESPDGWLKIENGTWKIKKDYPWDGCSGVWDFKKDIDEETGKPRAYYASLCHDVGYRYIRLCAENFPYSKYQIDKFFYRLMKAFRFRLSKIYFLGVLLFGRLFILLG